MPYMDYVVLLNLFHCSRKIFIVYRIESFSCYWSWQKIKAIFKKYEKSTNKFIKQILCTYKAVEFLANAIRSMSIKLITTKRKSQIKKKSRTNKERNPREKERERETRTSGRLIKFSDDLLFLFLSPLPVEFWPRANLVFFHARCKCRRIRELLR